MANKPMPTLYIGLGGSGAWTGVHVKHQLYNTYGNRLPDNVNIVILDTTNEMRVSVGGSDLVRRPGMGFGKVELSPSEWTWVGGDVYDLALRIANGKSNEYAHIGSWFQADRYLKEANRALFQLDKGAGMFRQFGRMALFRDLIAPAESKVRQIIDNKLVSLARNEGGSVAVMIVGSLTGGTGAGLFLDIAHLVRLAAAQNNINIKLRGFFFLPEAFASVLDGNQLEQARPRAFAAMRELKRFLLNGDYEIGYPMYYQPAMSGMGQSLWRGKAKGKLFDFVYLIDGRGERRLNARELKDGSAPVVADAIVSYIDHHFGQYQEEYDANIEGRTLLARSNVGQRAFIGTLGTHSYILPVQQMIEGWTFKLGREMLARIVLGQNYNEDGAVIGGLSYADNPQEPNNDPRRAAEDLMQSSQGMRDPGADNREIKPLPMWAQVLKVYQLGKTETGDQALQKLRAQPLDNWRGMLVPLGMEADQAIRKALQETQAALNKSIYDIEDAAPSDKRKQKDPENDWRVIGRTSETFINDQLGPVDPGGARTGGKFKEALDRFVDLQVERFSDYMRLYALHTLNGTLTRVNDPIQAKQGKLGWLIALTRELHTIFGEVTSMLEQVRMGRGASGPDRGAMIERRYREATEEMKAKAGETKVLGGNPYLKAQKSYLAAVEDYLRFYRTNFARNAVGFATQRITEFLHELLEELDLWQQLLATNSGSLYMRMQDGEKLIKGERARIDEVENHTIVNDVEWENEKYQEYVEERNATERLFEAWQWRTSIELDGRGNPSLRIDVEVADETFEKDMRRRWSERNADTVLNYARGFFQEAIQKESILKYLMRVRYPDSAAALGASLAEKSGHLLSMPETAIGTRARTFTLLAYDSGEADERSYLQAALNHLVARRGYGDTENRASAMAKLLQSDDPFRLTLLSSAELIPLDAIDSYTDAKPVYMGAKYTSRQLYHIFPAEETAACYEEQLVRLNQSKRMLSDRVVLLLEDEARFAHFMFLLAHGVIYKADIDYDGQTQSQWVMQLPEKRGQNNFWWLTMPSEDPSLLEALINFAVEQDDARARDPNQSYTNPIGTRYNDILDFLAQAQREDAISRNKNNNLALKNDDLRAQLEAFLPPLDEEGNEVLDGYTEADEQLFLEVAELVARRDILDDLRGYMAQRLPELGRIVQSEGSEVNTSTSHEERDQRQEEFDLFSTAVLLLTREIEKLDRRVERMYRRQIGDANPL